MPYKLRLSLPSIPKGALVAFHGLGELANKQEHIISDELAMHFRVANSKLEDIEGARPDQEGRIPYQSVLGPSLSDAFKDVEGITVAEIKTEGTVK